MARIIEYLDAIANNPKAADYSWNLLSQAERRIAYDILAATGMTAWKR